MKLFRYEYDSFKEKMVCVEFEVIRETNQSWVISLINPHKNYRKREKYVRQGCTAGWAHKNKDDALFHCLNRSKTHKHILEGQIHLCNKIIDKTEELIRKEYPEFA